MSQNVKDAIRARIFGEKVKSEVVELDEGLTIEVRQSTVGAMLDAISIEDNKQRMAIMLSMTCFVPGTEEKVFTPEDYEIIMAMPSGGTYQKLLDAINKFSPAKGVEQAKKTSEGELNSDSSKK